MRSTLLLIIAILSLSTFVGCNGGGGGYSGGGGGGGGGGYYYDDDYVDDDWYYDDYDYDDYDDYDYDDYDDDWGDDDWGDDDWDWDYDDDDDDCWDCGDDWGWYDDAQKKNGSLSKDMMGDIAAGEKTRLNKASKFFTNRFNLSAEQGLKIAKTVQDYQTLETRKATDLAEFSQKLYGLNPEEIVSSVSSAQVGDYSKLDSAIEKAAKNFDTTSANMKEIIKTLHGKALQENGIDL